MDIATSLLADITATTVILIVVGIIALVALFVIFQFFGVWLQAYMSRADVSFGDLIGMRLRKVHAFTIVQCKIQLVKAGIDNISTNDIESHYLAGGQVPAVCGAIIRANRANIELDWRKACAIDLAGRDILDAVNTSVNPKVIDCPGGAQAGGMDKLDAVSKDGIRLCERTFANSSAVQPKKPSSRASGKPSSAPSARRILTRTSSKTPMKWPAGH